MKAIVNTAPGHVAWCDLPEPQPAQGQVRIRTAACGICATDLEMIGGWDRTGYPSTPGHEWSGYVDAVGAGGDESLLDRPVVAENVLSDGGEVGFEHPGAYGQYLLTEAANVHVLPVGYPMPQATLIEPLAVSVRAMRRLDPRGGADALVIGDGPMGLFMVALLRRAGAGRVVCMGGRPSRLDMATVLGADRVLNYHELEDVPRALGGTFGAVVEASGAAGGIDTAMHACGDDATLLVVGDYGSQCASFAWNTILHRELRIVGSNASAGGWGEAVRIAAAGELPLAEMVSRVLPAAEYADALAAVRTDRTVVKVVLDWEG